MTIQRLESTGEVKVQVEYDERVDTGLHLPLCGSFSSIAKQAR